jgi:homospermidine synthase
MSPPASSIHAKISGPIVMIGFGSIGKGTLPLIERHFAYDKSRLVIIDPHEDGELAKQHGVRFIKQAITRDNYREVLVPLLTAGGGQGFCVNLSVDTSSVDIMTLCREIGALYIDTVVEPWLGFYFDRSAGPEARSNYALRETLLAAKHKSPGGPTAVSTCGANPGMVSWFVKQALLDIARDTNTPFNEPKSREGWGQLAHKLGVKGIHIAERDTQRSKKPKPMNVFVNTWSVEGFVSEGMQPAELGWGTHEKWMPDNGRTHKQGCGAAIYLLQPGANTRVRSWCPTPGAQYGFLVTHNESISIADYFTVRDGQRVVYRPTCHYAYHPANDAVLSLHEMFGATGKMQPKWHILDENEIEDGIDELGVLIYGHGKNAYWYGSQLSIEETREVAPYQNATGMQVSSAVLAGMVWALENPDAGIVEADEMDFRRCLEIQRPYLGPVKGYYTDWTPLTDRPGLFPEDIDTSDPWQFRNVLVR